MGGEQTMVMRPVDLPSDSMSINLGVGHIHRVREKSGWLNVLWKQEPDGRVVWESPGPSTANGQRVRSIDRKDHLRDNCGYRELLIRITDMKRLRLQDTTGADARALGMPSLEAVREQWTADYGNRIGTRWKDNPEVWHITFEVVGLITCR